METDIARGQWVDPRAGLLLLSTYAESWLAARADLKVRTRELYQWLLGKYVLPQLGHLPLDQLTPTAVRAWHASLLGAGAPTPPRQAYALLRAILNTAVADELLTRNPCLVRGAGVARSAERSVATLAQVQALAEAVPARYRMLILLAAWSGARWGELVALSLDRIDVERGTIGSTGSTSNLRTTAWCWTHPRVRPACGPCTSRRICSQSSGCTSRVTPAPR